MKAVLFILVLLPAVVFAQQQKQILTPQEFKMKSGEKTAVILDVRTPKEFVEGHLEKAVNKNVNDKDFSAYLSTLGKDKIYFVYCLAGKRSHTAATDMRKKGLTVYELDGGIENWQDRKLPVVK